MCRLRDAVPTRPHWFLGSTPAFPSPFPFPSGGVDQLDGQSLPIDCAAEVVAGRAGRPRNQGRFTPDQRVKERAFSRVRKPGQNDADPARRLHPRFALGQQFVHFNFRRRNSADDFVTRDELDVFVDKVEARFQVGQQVHQPIAKTGDASGDAAGQLAQRRRQVLGIGCVDDAQHGLRLHEIDSAGEKGPQGEFARGGRPNAPLEQIGQDGFQQGGRTGRVDFDDRLARVASPGGPKINENRKRCAD